MPSSLYKLKYPGIKCEHDQYLKICFLRASDSKNSFRYVNFPNFNVGEK